jgi:hypothetical protein
MTKGRSFAILLGCLLLAAGCDAGGLLVLESSVLNGAPDAGPTTVLVPQATELVNSGNVAANGKYKIVFTVGQSSPNQGVSQSADRRLNGGFIGAANDTK